MIKLIKNKDESGISSMIQQYGRYAAAIVTNLGLGNLLQEDVEEITADVFLAIWQHSDGLREDIAIKPYLAQTARHKTISFLRKNRLECSFDDDIICYSKTGLPDEVIVKEEQQRIINEAVEKMEQTEREIFVRFYYLGERIQTIAKILTINPSTIKTKLHRARKKLRSVFEERGYSYDEI